MPVRHDINVYRGDDYTLEVTVTGVDVDIFTYAAQVRDFHDASTQTAFGVSVDSVANVVVFSLTNEQTAAMQVLPSSVWDLQTTRIADSYVETWMDGRFTVTKDVTRV